ncbi:MAG TPA: gamma-glutamyl-gamma-aminobutyrate hydrolase family protein [Vicinamibacterales bacterium]|nr:gamma-glutamyl-gamma-aminobutyrate hydrolase family protein [Vicinamibacterales bacterium]
MPVIAIPPCAKLHDYEESIRRAGGEIRLLDRAVDKPAEVVASVDGVLLPGGGDVLPSIYGQAAHKTFSAAEPGRDDYELELARRAIDADLPVLAICRGVQVLNVARGGSLVQDIPEQLGTSVNHILRDPPHAIAHDVWIVEGSLLDQLMRERLETDTCPVNSRHHQAPMTLGTGLVASATAPDGVIEAIEDPNKRFCLGVQWHPENFYRTGEFRSLFEGFVEAAGRHRT